MQKEVPPLHAHARQYKWLAGYIHHREIAESNCLPHRAKNQSLIQGKIHMQQNSKEDLEY